VLDPRLCGAACAWDSIGSASGKAGIAGDAAAGSGAAACSCGAETTTRFKRAISIGFWVRLESRAGEADAPGAAVDFESLEAS
jgi:hypothetical protein